MNPDTVRMMRWVSGGLEAFFGIPIIGGSIIIGLNWTPLLFLLILHIIIVVFSYQYGVCAYGNIFGIVSSCIGWIPIVGMVMHILTAIFIFIELIKTPEKAVGDGEAQ